MKRIIAVCALLLFISALQAIAQTVNTQKLDSLFAALDAGHKMMGTITIAKDGKPLYTKSIGSYKLENGKELKANNETVYRIGSITKIFTAVMIFQLIEEKKLTLDSKLSEFYPKVPYASQISIRQMLNHHSGIFDFTTAPRYSSSWALTPKTEDEILNIIYQTDEALIPPAIQAGYSNANYILLGYIVEKLTGLPYNEALKKRIVTKLDLKHTYYGGKINTAANEASSYMNLSGKWVERPETDMSIPGGAGAIVSTTEDLNKFITALFNLKLISEPSIDHMATIEDNFGMGIVRFPFNQRFAYGHTGGIDGFISEVAYFPDDHVSIAITMNASNYSMNNIALGMLKIFYNMPFEIPSFAAVKTDAALLVKYAGVYGSKQVPLKITVKNENGQLVAQASGQEAFLLEAVSDTEFKYDAAGVKMIFKKKEGSEKYDFTLLQGGGTFLFEKE